MAIDVVSNAGPFMVFSKLNILHQSPLGCGKNSEIPRSLLRVGILAFRQIEPRGRVV